MIEVILKPYTVNLPEYSILTNIVTEYSEAYSKHIDNLANENLELFERIFREKNEPILGKKGWQVVEREIAECYWKMQNDFYWHRIERKFDIESMVNRIKYITQGVFYDYD